MNPIPNSRLKKMGKEYAVIRNPKQLELELVALKLAKESEMKSGKK